MEVWRQVQKQLRAKPVAAGSVGGATPLYAERYLLHDVERSVEGLNVLVLVTQFGGARVREGEVGSWRAVTLPSQSLLIPRNCATHWHYSGATDFAVFYFPDTSPTLVDRFLLLTARLRDPLLFSDPLVGAAAMEIMTELQKGKAADQQFMKLLAAAMLEQTYRALTASKTGLFSPRHIHLARLQKVLPHIREHLADDLRAQTLAQIAGVSVAHFRRLFVEALGISLHRYILNARLEKARRLLGTTEIPILRVAQECGFSSQSHLTASFKIAHAATPAEFRGRIRQG